MSDPELPDVLRRHLLRLHFGHLVASCVGAVSSWALFYAPMLSCSLVMAYSVTYIIKLEKKAHVFERSCCCVYEHTDLLRIVSPFLAVWSTAWTFVGIVHVCIVTDVSALYRFCTVLAFLAHSVMAVCAAVVWFLCTTSDTTASSREPVVETYVEPRQFINTEPTAPAATPPVYIHVMPAAPPQPQRPVAPTTRPVVEVTPPAAQTISRIETNTLADSGTQGDVDGAVGRRIRIFYRHLTTDVRALEVSLTDTVAGLAARIAALEGHSAASFHLTANGSIMADPERTLASYNVQKDTTVTMLFRMT